jgi:hypothetical protein
MQIIAVLAGSRLPSETVLAEYRRKEEELCGLFAELTLVEAATLLKRLRDAEPDDQMARRFAALVPERRGRLLAFLADAPRRARSAVLQSAGG